MIRSFLEFFRSFPKFSFVNVNNAQLYVKELAAEVTDALVLTVDAGEVVAEEIIQPVLENDVVEEIHNLVASEIKADTEALEDVKDDAAAAEDVAATENDVSTEDAAEKVVFILFKKYSSFLGIVNSI